MPGDLDRPTGGSVYDRRVIGAWRDSGLPVRVLRWGDGFPRPSDTERAEAAADLASLPDGSTVLVDGLALGVIPDIAASQAGRLRLCALVHHPLALETGVRVEERQRLMASERRALAQARSVIATSHETARRLAEEFSVPRERLHVAVPGLDPQPLLDGPPRDGHLVLAVGAPSPRKGFDLLLPAVAALAPPWHCRIVGSLDHYPSAAESLRQAVTRQGLAGRVHLCGALDDDALAGAYDAAAIFVCPSHYEGYGMAIAEALVHGLPVIATSGCAIVHELPPGCLMRVEAGDQDGLRAALARLAADPGLRARLGMAGREAARHLPGWRDTAGVILSALGLSEHV